MWTLVPMSEIDSEEVDFVVPARLSRGKLTLLTGRAGSGKSIFSLLLVATCSREGGLPDGSVASKLKTLILASEDEAANTILPRLRNMGVDESQVIVPKERLITSFTDLAELQKLKEAIKAHNIDLIVLDPMNSFISGFNNYNEMETRKAVEPLTKVLEETGAAGLAILHPNKSQHHTNAVDKMQGSTAFPAVARVVLNVIADPCSGMKYVEVVKNNLTGPQKVWRYEITDDGSTHPSVSWKGEIDRVPDGLLRPDGDTKEGKIFSFIEDKLNELNDEIDLEVIKRYEEESGISHSTAKAAKKRLGLKDSRKGLKRFWIRESYKEESEEEETMD